MALGLEDKKAIVAEVNEAAQSALSAVIADYRGLSVGQMTSLRKQAREGGVYLKVVRNTLAKRAVDGTEFQCLQDSLVGPTVIAFSQEDPGAAARLMKDFSKENQELEVKALSISGQVLGAEQIDVLAKMPTLDQARRNADERYDCSGNEAGKNFQRVPCFYYPSYGGCCRREEKRSLIAFSLLFKRFLVNPKHDFSET